jgi:hypothetical protein
MLAAEYNITIEQGATFEDEWTWTDDDGNAVNLTDLDIECKIQATRESAAAIIEGSYEGSTDTPTGDIVIAESGASGLFSITITAANTENLDFSQAYWFLEISNSAGSVWRVLEGVAKLSKR